MEALPPGWIRERYTTDEAVIIVVWARYGGPHPASGGEPSRQATANATRDVRPLVKIETRTIEVPVSSRTARFRQAGTGDPSRPTRQPTHRTEERIVHDRYVERADLAALCPGILPDPHPDLSPIERRRADRILEIAQALDVDVLRPRYGWKKKIKVECLKESRLFTDDTFEHTWKTRETWAKSPADIRPDSA
ncbi:hypothetical protein [Thiocapsa sp. UBA6158]|uniref:hypothetical protein n=1 Tax=Thiocapsa sp. UBA6158 TaxID=1947692 RepID=UPI0025E61B38|nr:hypothetical protein [Thiocapsa sp. UBA6158]